MTKLPIRNPRPPFDARVPARPFWESRESRLLLKLAAGFIALCGIVAYFFFTLSEREAKQAPPVVVAPLPPQDAAERERFLLTAFEGALSDAANGDMLRESSGYLKLVKTVSEYTPEQVTQKATRQLDYAAALADPDAWRGQFVRARGVLAGLETVQLDRPDYGRSFVYRGAMTDGDASNGVLFDLPEHPGEKPSIQGKAYDLEGLFYRTASYEAHDGKLKVAPWLIVRNLTLVPSRLDQRSRFVDEYGLFILGGMALFVGGLLTYALRRRPARPDRAHPAQAEDIRAMFERRLREESSPPPPSATP
jgi:hypothetical protein